MMDADERDVYLFLKPQPEQFVPAVSICRYAGGKRRFRESSEWAVPVLRRMLERGIVELDVAGNFRLKPMPKSDAPKRWVSPHIAAILKKSGDKFDHFVKEEDKVDAYYNSL